MNYHENRVDFIEIQVTRTGYFVNWRTSPSAYDDGFVASPKSDFFMRLNELLDRVQANAAECRKLHEDD